jgi:hypothetical protein
MIVWAKAPDRNGVVKATARPLLITSIHPSNKKAPFVAHCISTRTDNYKNDPVIEMPWDPKTGAGTGLFAKCFLVLGWSVIVDQNDVEEISGAVEKEFLALVLERIARLHDPLGS